MSDLAGVNVAKLNKDSQAMQPGEVQRYLEKLPGWEMLVEQDEPRLRKKYSFKDFAQALAFTNRVGAIAEEEDHHPALLTEWGAVTVWWWTHKVRGLHMNDLVMAARTDQLYHG